MHCDPRSRIERRSHHCPRSREGPPCTSYCLQRCAAAIGCRRGRSTTPARPLRLRSQWWQSEIGWAVILARSIPPLLAE